MRKLVLSLLAAFFVGLPSWPCFANELVTGKSGMVVTAHPVASEFGLQILQAGGNAVDAAVGAAIVLGVVEPHASGFGGGGGMLIYLQAEDSLTYINYYARAPRLVPTDFDSDLEAHTGQAVLVPGTVAGLYHALSNYGTYTWHDLLTLTIKELEDGFKVDAALFQLVLDAYEVLTAYPQTHDLFLPGGFPHEEGETIRNERILGTLDKLAQGGPDVFYRGEIADSIVAVVTRNGSGLRKSDLRTYRALEISPVKGTYRGYGIITAPPPHSGVALLEILNILEFRNLSDMGNYSENLATFHFMAEAMKRGYADRLQYLSDPEFRDVPVGALISKSFARSRYKTIRKRKAVPSVPKKTPAGDVSHYQDDIRDHDGSTTHISVIDAAGNAVSLTQTNNRFWGSGISVGGFLLNNGMTGFSRSNPANTVLSGRQPRSTISPTMLFNNGKLVLVIGSPGAGRITSTMVEVISNIIDFGMDAGEANRAPRFHSRKWLNTLPVEDRFAPEMLDRLRAMGHTIEVRGEMDLFFGGVQLIMVDFENGLFIGSADPRRSGVAKGY